MSFVPMYRGTGVKCSVTPTAECSGGGWYCVTCNTQFGERANPPCGEEALPHSEHDKPGLQTVVNPPRVFR